MHSWGKLSQPVARLWLAESAESRPVERVCRVSLAVEWRQPTLLHGQTKLAHQWRFGRPGRLFFSFEVAKDFLVSESLGQEAPWGMYILAAQTSVSSYQVSVCLASETARSFPVEAVGGGWGGSQLTGSAKAYQHTHTGDCAFWCALELTCSVYSCSEVKCASCQQCLQSKGLLARLAKHGHRSRLMDKQSSAQMFWKFFLLSRVKKVREKKW